MSVVDNNHLITDNEKLLSTKEIKLVTFHWRDLSTTFYGKRQLALDFLYFSSNR